MVNCGISVVHNMDKRIRTIFNRSTVDHLRTLRPTPCKFGLVSLVSLVIESSSNLVSMVQQNDFEESMAWPRKPPIEKKSTIRPPLLVFSNKTWVVHNQQFDPLPTHKIPLTKKKLNHPKRNYQDLRHHLTASIEETARAARIQTAPAKEWRQPEQKLNDRGVVRGQMTAKIK